MFVCTLKFWSNLSYQLTPSFPSQLYSDLCSCRNNTRLPFLFKWYLSGTNGVPKVLNSSPPRAELKQLWTLSKVGLTVICLKRGVSPVQVLFMLRSPTYALRQFLYRNLEARRLFAFHMNTLLRNNRELKQPRRRRQQEPYKLAYLKMKTGSIFLGFVRAFFNFITFHSA